jgi:hypothetical protein
MHIDAIEDPLGLGSLAASIRHSSNFRFAWRFYRVQGKDLRQVGSISAILRAIIEVPALHSFLADTPDNTYPSPFQIEPLHRHASIDRDLAGFLDTMARASLDRLGAYSQDLSPSTPDEREVINKLFSRVGSYSAYTINPGTQADCEDCRQHDSHLFSNWFYGVAWDYTFLVTWPLASILWMACLTDTD